MQFSYKKQKIKIHLFLSFHFKSVLKFESSLTFFFTCNGRIHSNKIAEGRVPFVMRHIFLNVLLYISLNIHYCNVKKQTNCLFLFVVLEEISLGMYFLLIVLFFFLKIPIFGITLMAFFCSSLSFICLLAAITICLFIIMNS